MQCPQCGNSIKSLKNDNQYIVGCSECKLIATGDSHSEAMKRWNDSYLKKNVDVKQDNVNRTFKR